MKSTKEYIEFLKKALQNENVKAFLNVIRKCEGTDAKDGYSYLFGSNPRNKRRFTDFSKHPKLSFPFGKTTSSAAGAYQIMGYTYDDLVDKLGITDFSPESQDLMACERISYRNCLQKLIDGKFEEVINGCNKEWASLPNSPYGQPVKTMQFCKDLYIKFGGKIG
jgi:muramidase (phage lysozyme)